MKKRGEKEDSELMLALEREDKLFLERLSPEERVRVREDMLAVERLSSEEREQLSSENMLKLARFSFERSNNPYYAWYAIDVCTKNKMQLPNWLMPYLAQCSQRMLSSTARQTGDLRKLLPSVLGFPQKKPGPGNLLDPDRAQQKTWFAFNFAARISAGDDPVTARKNASESLDVKAAGADDTTLQRWLREEFNLKEAPTTTEQWKKILNERGLLPLLKSMDQLYRRLHFWEKSRETPP